MLYYGVPQDIARGNCKVSTKRILFVSLQISIINIVASTSDHLQKIHYVPVLIVLFPAGISCLWQPL